MQHAAMQGREAFGVFGVKRTLRPQSQAVFSGRNACSAWDLRVVVGIFKRVADVVGTPHDEAEGAIIAMIVAKDRD